MIIYFTGASSLGAAQPLSSLSLGGYKSSNVVPNDVMNNLFSDESEMGHSTEKKEIRCIAVTTDVLITELLVGVNRKNVNETCLIKLGFSKNSSATPTEMVYDQNSSPMTIGFNDELYMSNSGDTANMFSVTTLDTNQVLYIWIQRTLKPNTNAEAVCLLDDDLIDIKSGFDLVFNITTA